MKARVKRLKARVEAVKPLVKGKNSNFKILNSRSSKRFQPF